MRRRKSSTCVFVDNLELLHFVLDVFFLRVASDLDLQERVRLDRPLDRRLGVPAVLAVSQLRQGSADYLLRGIGLLGLGQRQAFVDALIKDGGRYLRKGIANNDVQRRLLLRVSLARVAQVGHVRRRSEAQLLWVQFLAALLGVAGRIRAALPGVGRARVALVREV